MTLRKINGRFVLVTLQTWTSHDSAGRNTYRDLVCRNAYQNCLFHGSPKTIWHQELCSKCMNSEEHTKKTNWDACVPESSATFTNLRSGQELSWNFVLLLKLFLSATFHFEAQNCWMRIQAQLSILSTKLSQNTQICQKVCWNVLKLAYNFFFEL